MISEYLKKTLRPLMAAATLGCLLSSCDGVIYDDEGDCAVNYRVAFRYDRNMKWADAFANEVHSVHLYAFDKQGTLVWQQAEKGEALASEGYAMTLDLPAGDYTLLTWAGLDNGVDKSKESFSTPEARVGVTRLEEMQCTLNRQHDEAGNACCGQLYPLFHGMTNVSLPLNLDGGDYNYVVPLTKNTNHVRVILQHLSGEPVDVDGFTFRIEEENGWMDYDNSLLPDEKITYYAYHTASGTADMGIDDYPEPGDTRKASSRTVTSVSVAIADLATARLTEGRKTYLTIETKTGKTTARIPLTDYALLLKDGYGHDMTDQEYLDRQDEYALTFFLDESEQWIGTSIIINSWKLVIDNVDFQ